MSRRELPELKTIKEAAEILRIRPQTVYRMCWAGEIGTVKVRGRRLIPTMAILDYLNRGRGRRKVVVA